MWVLLLNHENWSDLFLQQRPGPEVIPALAANRQKPPSEAFPLVNSGFICAASMAAVKARSHSQICLLQVPLSFSEFKILKLRSIGPTEISRSWGKVADVK